MFSKPSLKISEPQYPLLMRKSGCQVHATGNLDIELGWERSKRACLDGDKVLPGHCRL